MQQQDRERLEGKLAEAEVAALVTPSDPLDVDPSALRAAIDRSKKLSVDVTSAEAKLATVVKAHKAKEARANAKNDLHKAMFAVADELGGTFANLRDASGEARFEAKELVFGRPQQAALGVEHYLCVQPAAVRSGMNEGLNAIRAEVKANGTDIDNECLEYVLEMEAGSSGRRFQGSLKRDCDEHGNLLPERRAKNGRGMRLSDFVNHPNAKTAKLTDAHTACPELQ